MTKDYETQPPTSTITVALRPYQIAGIEALRAAMRAGKRRVLAVLPTGGGKTLCAAAIIAGAVAKSKRALFLAHRRELISQCYSKLCDAGVAAADLGTIIASDRKGYRPQASVQIASVQTLVGRVKPPADLVFIDEAHHAAASSYLKILEHYPTAHVIGLTATPVRADGKGLNANFDTMVQIATFRDLAALGFLVTPKVYTAPLPPDLRGVKTTGGDYNLRDLDAAMNTRALVGDLVTHWVERAEGRSTIVFASSVGHSVTIAETFVAAGIAAEHLDGTTDGDTRAAILARLASGETRVVCNFGVLTEGFDCPRAKCITLARPTQSLGLFLQMVGRGLRPYEGLGALLLDHAGCVRKHGFPQDDRTWSLEGRPKGAGEAPVKVCPQCKATIPAAAQVCPECGHVFEREGLAVVEGDLVEVLPPALAPVDVRRAWYASQLDEAARRGRKLGWARHRYREQFGAWPNGFGALEREHYTPPDPLPALAAAKPPSAGATTLGRFAIGRTAEPAADLEWTL